MIGRNGRGIRNLAIVALLGVLMAGGPVFGQDDGQSFEETIQNLSEDAARGYAGPVVDGFGANLNTGWFNRAPAATVAGLNLKIGIVAMGALIADEDLSFETQGSFRFAADEARDLAASGIDNWNSLPPSVQDDIIQEIIRQDFGVTIAGPTIFGSESENVRVITGEEVITSNGQSYTIDGQTIELDGVTGLLEDPSLFPTAAPQITVGTVYGTNLSVRFIPSVKIDDEIGELSYFGWALRHNINTWFKTPLPVDVTVGLMRQSLSIGDIFEASGTGFGVNVSKEFGFAVGNIAPFAGFMLESSEMDFSYTYELAAAGNGTPAVTSDINFTIEGANSSRFTIGTAIYLLGVDLIADMGFGSTNTVSVTAQFGL